MPARTRADAHRKLWELKEKTEQRCCQLHLNALRAGCESPASQSFLQQDSVMLLHLHRRFQFLNILAYTLIWNSKKPERKGPKPMYEEDFNEY
jgi:hypothetical protein